MPSAPRPPSTPRSLPEANALLVQMLQPQCEAREAQVLPTHPVSKATVWISAASVWEIAIKHSLGRGDMPISCSQAMAYFQEAGYRFSLIRVR